MIRSTFANIQLRNQLAPGTEAQGPCHLPTASRWLDARRPLSGRRRAAYPGRQGTARLVA
jgi:hypothetical protein